MTGSPRLFYRALAVGFAGLLFLSAYGSFAPASARCPYAGKIGCAGGLFGPPSASSSGSGDQWFNVVLYDYGFWITNTVSGANESANWTVFENFDVHINATSEPPVPSAGGTNAHGIGLIWSGTSPNFVLYTTVGNWINSSFVAPGSASYRDRVYCTNPCGTGHSGMSVNVLNIVPVGPPPAVNATATPASGYAPLSVDFHSTVTGGTPPYSYLWSFGDQSGAYAANPTHFYGAPGTYPVHLGVLDQNGQLGESNLSVDVRPTPTFSVTVNASVLSGLAPLAVHLIANATGGVGPYSYSWSFGDGGVGVGPTIDHTYQLGGTFYAVSSVRDARGYTSGASVLITVRSSTASPLRLAVEVVPSVGDLPLEVNATASISGGNGSLGPVTWEFGDGSARARGPVAQHTYLRLDPGRVNLTAFVTDASGDLAAGTEAIELDPAPSANLSVRIPRPVAPAAASLTVRLAGGNGTFASIAWDYGDGTTGTGGTPRAHLYEYAGHYRVTVTGLDSNGRRLGAVAWVNLSANASGGISVRPVAATSLDLAPIAFLGVVGASGLVLVIAAAWRESHPGARPPGGSRR